jgi:uncharacterized protein (TIGR01777 family)
MPENKCIVVVGATGTIGKALSKSLMERGYDVVVFSRNPDTAHKSVPGAAEYVAWQPEETGAWFSAIDGAFAVINLAGAPFFKRWTPEYKQEVTNSRVQGTRGLINAMKEAKIRPQVFIVGTSQGYYGFDGTNRDQTMDEIAPAGNDFWGQDTASYEKQIAQAESLGIRTIMLRTGVLLSEDSGPLPQQVPQYLRGFGGPVLPGSQWSSWIHIADEVGIILFALEHEQVSGPINLTAPEPVRNRDFAKTLGKVLHRPAWFPVPGFMLKLFLGEVANVIIGGRRVVPKKIMDAGYQFQYPTLEPALRQLLHRP